MRNKAQTFHINMKSIIDLILYKKATNEAGMNQLPSSVLHPTLFN